MSEPASSTDRPVDVLHRLVGAEPASALNALRSVSAASTELEGYRPLHESLEWRLASAYWDGAGVLPFVRNDVPYLVNNTGRLSENAAEVVFAALDEISASLPRQIVFLELGAGSGLHARYFLDAFRDKCQREGSDLYDRLTYVVTDRFDAAVVSWQRVGLYADHEGHVAPCVCDAAEPLNWSLPGGRRAAPVGAPVVVFCNYVLDVLPSHIARRGDGGLEQLSVRTHLAAGGPALRAAGVESIEEARALAASGTLADLKRLLPLLGDVELETAFLPWTPSGSEEPLAASVTDGHRVIVNGGALACLEKVLAALPAAGFVVVNDYGPVRPEDVGNHVGVQRFGGSVALGLNFPLLERILVERGFTVTAAEGDEHRRVHTRLIGRGVGERAREAFCRRFAHEADRHRDAPLDEARAHVAAGRRSDALDAYRLLIERNPNDWQMLGEAAEYVGLQLHDYGAGLELARSALQRNPWFSSWLWNVLGDCLFYREKLDAAHEAFVQGLRIDPDDPRTNLNVAYTLSARGDQGAALAAIARGLANDGRGVYRPRLLEKQSAILALISERSAAIQNRLARRAERFR